MDCCISSSFRLASLPLLSLLTYFKILPFYAENNWQIILSSMDATITATPQPRTSHFLNLPPELRSIIYTYLIIEDDPIEVYRQLVCKVGRHASATSYPCPTSCTLSPLASTYFLGYEYAVRPGLPAIASVSTLVRNEVLPLYFSANKFSIYVANGYLGTSPFPWSSVDEWRQHLGHYARHLRDVMVTTHNLYVFPSVQPSQRQLLAARATLRGAGTMLFGLAACEKYFCVCGLRSASGEQLGRGEEDGGGEKDGGQLLTVLEDWIEAAYYYDPRSTERCGNCGLPQLTYATDEVLEPFRGLVRGGAWT